MGKLASIWIGSAVLLAGCTGGQSGHTTNASCEQQLELVPPDRAVDGTTPRQLALTFVGRYAAALRWSNDEDPALRDAASSAPDDELRLVIGYEEAPGQLDSCSWLSVPVRLQVSTREVGEIETGSAQLKGILESPENGSLSFEGERIHLSAALTRVQGEVQLEGTLESSDGDLPARQAEFSRGIAQEGAGP